MIIINNDVQGIREFIERQLNKRIETISINYITHDLFNSKGVVFQKWIEEELLEDKELSMVETSNGRNCRDCNKYNVCKYQEKVVEEVERLIGEMQKIELPLSININCIEWAGKVNVR